MMSYHEKDNAWRISLWDGSRNEVTRKKTMKGIYKSQRTTNCVTPPEKGWTLFGLGRNPAPTCRPIYNSQNVATGTVRASVAANQGGSAGNIRREHVVVAGCGMTEINGVYTKTMEQKYGCPVYIKKEGTRIFQLHRRAVQQNFQQKKYWYINSYNSVKADDSYYRAPLDDKNKKIPPKDGWERIDLGCLPALTLTWHA